MSVKEIVEYVRQTPGNTNPSVIASMVNAEMNSTLEEAKKYTDSKGGYTIPGKVLTYDGNKAGKPVVESYVKISDSPIDVNAVKSVTFGGITIATENLVTVSEGTISAILLENDALVTSITEEIDGFSKGVWVLHSDFGYVSKIIIDQKFIPGAVLPVVTISNDTVMNAFNSGGEPYPLTASESATFEGIKNSGGPIIVRAYTGEGFYSCALCSADYHDPHAVFNCNMFSGGMKIDVTIENRTGDWTMTVAVIE